METDPGRQTIVIDTAIIALWFQRVHPLRATAIGVRDDIVSGRLKVLIPDLALEELQSCLNACGSYDVSIVEKAVASILLMGIRVVPNITSCVSRAIQLTHHCGITPSEGYFIALAENYGCEYWTLSEELCKTLPDWSLIRRLR